LEDQALIEWSLKYISEQTTTRFLYKDLEKDIALGPESPRAKTGKLQEDLRLMKEAVEWWFKNSTNINILSFGSVNNFV